MDKQLETFFRTTKKSRYQSNSIAPQAPSVLQSHDMQNVPCMPQ